MMPVETIDFYCIETYDFELINIVFPGIAEGADLNTYIVKIKVGKNDYKMKLQNSDLISQDIRIEDNSFERLIANLGP